MYSYYTWSPLLHSKVEVSRVDINLIILVLLESILRLCVLIKLIIMASPRQGLKNTVIKPGNDSKKHNCLFSNPVRNYHAL